MNISTSASIFAPLSQPAIICFSHLRWDFVLQRPQHLMQRFAAERRVFFFEEHIPTDHHLAYLEFHRFEGTEVVAVRPRVPHGWQGDQLQRALARLLDELVAVACLARPVLWFYTPMMLPFAQHLDASAVIYDCMDELSGFRFAPSDIQLREDALIRRADVVFTGGHSIYQAKRDRHANIHPFPSSVDAAHFAAARRPGRSPADQASIPGPVLGYYGVIDERIDLALIAHLAAARPDWSIVMVGPVAKIDPADLPRAANIHYLGRKSYDELPAYVAGWDVALMPFAINEATKFISPTKTPEYLAAGRPVVSTPITDVIRHYGDTDGVLIARSADDFVDACQAALALAERPQSWLPAVDAMLARSSWDETFRSMASLLDEAAMATSHRLHKAETATDAGSVSAPVSA